MVEIRSITNDDADEAISVIAAVVYDVYGEGEPTPETLVTVRENLLRSGSLDDMQDLTTNYERDSGLFLVLVDDGNIVGTGALKRLDHMTAELGRLWFLPAYRGRGFGWRMADQLLEFARNRGYQRVRLDTSDKCVDAINLFRKLGFQDIERYKESATSLFMELRLND